MQIKNHFALDPEYCHHRTEHKKFRGDVLSYEKYKNTLSAEVIRCISHELYSSAEYKPSSQRNEQVCYRMVNGYYKEMQMIFSQRHGKSMLKFVMATKEQYQQLLLNAHDLKIKLMKIGGIDNLEVIYGPENLQQNLV
ncbi:hypothetical protein HZV92_001823 [Salmonella enterica]|nr:hypothetical protein [Salmonella enterica]